MKSFIKSLTKHKGILNSGVFLGILSGIISFIFMSFFNYMIKLLLSESYTKVSILYIILTVFIFVISIWAQRTLSYKIIKLSQQIYWDLRHELLKMILKSNYQEVRKKRDAIHTALVSDVNSITSASLGIISLITAIVVVISCLGYMIFLSGKLFLMTALVTGIGVLVYSIGSRKGMVKYNKVRDLEDKFLSSFNAILFGFKEIFISPEKGKSIYEDHVVPTSKESYKKSIEASVIFLNSQIFIKILVNLLMAVILLVLSVIIDIEGLVVVQFLFVLQYLQASITSLLTLLPILGQAKISLDRFSKLKTSWESGDESDKESNIIDRDSFINVNIQNVFFEYKPENEEEDSKFSIGPIDLSINRGDVVFVYGGNGSGKTTFINILTGVLSYNKGNITYNGTEISIQESVTYRSLFAPVFSDFYLFDEFFGNSDFDKEKANYYLELFELEGKVGMTDKGFESTNFSTGQRKRLALIAVLLERKPIIVLDEWAADQDPYFRKKFYTQIIPLLKKEGFTIIAVTHDDMYYSCADKLFKMQYGKLNQESGELKISE